MKLSGIYDEEENMPCNANHNRISNLRITVLVILLGFFPFFTASGETVLLHIENPEWMELAAAVEDGIMEVFFDNGHIIFNTGLNHEMPPDPPFKAERAALRIAKSGGAGFLLEVRLGDLPGENQAPLELAYILSNVMEDGEILRGQILVEEVMPEKLIGARELCTLMGRAVAIQALVGL